MPRLVGEVVARAIRTHQIAESNPWRYRRLVAELHTWLDRFDIDYDLRTPTAVIAIAEQRVEVLATYRLGRSDIGARTTITFNERWIERRPFIQTLETLMHEAVHAWEEWHEGREHGGWYHTVAWRERMREIGIVADIRGRHLDVLPSFRRYLDGYGVPDLQDLLPNAVAFVDQSVDQPTRRRQLTKWVCSCPGGNPARATQLRAICQVCGALYVPV